MKSGIGLTSGSLSISEEFHAVGVTGRPFGALLHLQIKCGMATKKAPKRARPPTDLP